MTYQEVEKEILYQIRELKRYNISPKWLIVDMSTLYIILAMGKDIASFVPKEHMRTTQVPVDMVHGLKIAFVDTPITIIEVH